MKLLKHQIMSFAFFFTMTHQLVEEKLVPLKANALITVATILKDSVPLYFIIAFCSDRTY